MPASRPLLLAAAEAPQDSDRAAVEEASAAAREARRLADLAEEERRLARMLGGLKARAYRGARAAALSANFTALALAADQAAKTGPDSLPEAVRGSAPVAADLARQLRDQKGQTEPLLHDPAFLRDVLLRYLYETAKDSGPAQRLRGWIDSAQAFGKRLLDRLPGGGAKETGE